MVATDELLLSKIRQVVFELGSGAMLQAATGLDV
jgi:hypothetical protein